MPEGFGAGRSVLGVHASPRDLLALQRLAGNRAVAELLAPRATGAGTSHPTAVQRGAGVGVVVQCTLADTVKQVAAVIGVAATVGAIAAYFFIPAAVAYAVLAAAGGLGTAFVVDRLQAQAPPQKTLSPPSPGAGPPKPKSKAKKKAPSVVPKARSAREQMDDLEQDPSHLVQERTNAEDKYVDLKKRKEVIRQRRKNIRQVGMVPVDGDPTNQFPWINAPNHQVYNNGQGYLPPGAYTEYYRDITGGAQHHRMIRDDASNERWFTYGGTHNPVPGAWWAYWDGNRWWRWVGPTDAGGAGLGVATDYNGYPVADIPNGDKLTELEVLLLEADIAFYSIKPMALDRDLTA